MIYLDTHVVVWLYAGRTDLFPPLAKSQIDGNDLLISPLVGSCPSKTLWTTWGLFRASGG